MTAMRGATGRGWVGWVAGNRVVASILAAALVITVVDISLIGARSGGSSHAARAGGATTRVNAGNAGAATTTSTLPGGGSTAAGGAGGAGGGSGGTGGGGFGGGGSTGGVVAGTSGGVSGVGSSAAPCAPADDNETGVTKSTVTIGEIISDVSAIPAQLKPSYEGLQAYIKLVNDTGGVCGRKIQIDYSNDNANPATHDYANMTHKVFAFVANGSLIDGTDYQSDQPFNPTTQDRGEYVPDIGGLALTYARAQSPWFVSPIGSIDPSLTGGDSYRYLLDEAAGRISGVAASPHGACRKVGVMYEREPTGIGMDQGQLAGIALAAPWGGNMGSNVKYYVTNLADPTPVYEQYVNQMVGDGVNCVFTLNDLQSDINLAQAVANRGVWPPDKCHGPTCFSIVAMGFGGYDEKFVHDAGDGGRDVSVYALPTLPLSDTSNPAMATYLRALSAIRDAQPGAYSLLGYISGVMFVDALRACGAAPTRLCVMNWLRGLKGYSTLGLVGPLTPFSTTAVRCSGTDCGSFHGVGVYHWKPFTPCSTTVRVLDLNGKRDFYRIAPPGGGFMCGAAHLARGSPA